MWRRVGLVAASLLAGSHLIVFAALLATVSARAADMSPPPVAQVDPAYKAPPVETWSSFYFGGSLTRVHHTGYVPNTPWSAQQYAWGEKVFVGYRFVPWIAVEGAYHYLGRITYTEGPFVLNTEQSYAVSGSVVFTSPSLSDWVGPTYLPIHFFVRLGLAYKNIRDETVLGTFNEGVLSGVFGAGFEFRPTQNVFMRLEYEFLSTALGGPTQPVPALNSLFTVSIGGTRNAINVMHTPLALTVGVNF